MGKVDGAHGTVAADAGHGPLVALEHLTNTCLTGERDTGGSALLCLSGLNFFKYKAVKWFAPY